MKIRNFMKIAIICLLLGNVALSNAQVTIGSGNPPSKFSLLDLDTSIGKKALHLPRLTTADAENLVKSTSTNSDKALAAGLFIYNVDSNCIELWDGSAWRSFCENTRWFYMPSIVIDVTTSGTFSRDLHLEYKKQFADTDDASTPTNSPTAGTTLVKSDMNAPNPFNKIYAANELYFYVTGYDAAVFSNLSITSAGVLTYTVNAANVTGATYMNIVFVIK